MKTNIIVTKDNPILIGCDEDFYMEIDRCLHEIFENESFFVETYSPCMSFLNTRGKYPVYMVNVRDKNEMVYAFFFQKTESIRKGYKITFYNNIPNTQKTNEPKVSKDASNKMESAPVIIPVNLDEVEESDVLEMSLNTNQKIVEDISESIEATRIQKEIEHEVNQYDSQEDVEVKIETNDLSSITLDDEKTSKKRGRGRGRNKTKK